MYAKYEVSTFNPVPGEECTGDANNANSDDGQSMIV